MDENLYDEFGNYIGPEIASDEEEEEEEEEQEDGDGGKTQLQLLGKFCTVLGRMVSREQLPFFCPRASWYCFFLKGFTRGMAMLHLSMIVVSELLHLYVRHCFMSGQAAGR